MNLETLTNWKDTIISTAGLGFVGCIISVGAWMNLAIHDRPTEDEVVDLISSHAPYTRDQLWIQKKFDSVDQTTDKVMQSFERTSDKMTEVIQRNTDAINALRLQFAAKEARDSNVSRN